MNKVEGLANAGFYDAVESLFESKDSRLVVALKLEMVEDVAGFAEPKVISGMFPSPLSRWIKVLNYLKECE